MSASCTSEPDVSPTARFLEQCWAEALSAARVRHGMPPLSSSDALLASPLSLRGHASTTLVSPAEQDDRDDALLPREYGQETASQRDRARAASVHSPAPRLPLAGSASTTAADRPLTIERAESLTSPAPSSMVRSVDRNAPSVARPARAPATQRRPSFTVEAQPNLVRGKRASMGTNGVAWVVQ